MKMEKMLSKVTKISIEIKGNRQKSTNRDNFIDIDVVLLYNRYIHGRTMPESLDFSRRFKLKGRIEL